MDFIDVKYINLLSLKLQKFKKVKHNLFNCRCPICGDSKKNVSKARGYFYQVKNNTNYKCHNCGASMRFDKFLEMMDPALYKEYRLEKFKETHLPRKVSKLTTQTVGSQPAFKRDFDIDLTPLNDLNNSHPAKEYILNRRLPTESLYYTESFMEWTNSVKPETFPEVTHDEGRIIIPFRDKEGNTFGFQGRSLSSTGLRYITVLLQEGQPKIFGLNTIDYGKTIYVVEGPLDSLLVDNCIAMAGADLSMLPSSLGKNLVFVFDNEPRNVHITSRIDMQITAGNKVVIWPSGIKQKDVNDMVLAGIDVNTVIQSNTYSGLTATLKLNDWRK